MQNITDISGEKNRILGREINVDESNADEDKPCMNDCGRHLYIPGEIKRIQKLLSGYGA